MLTLARGELNPMANINLTTKEVARLLHVSEATVKRWADDGRLRSDKTVGGHRRFSIQTIAHLRREQGIGQESQPPLRKAARGKTPNTPLPSSASFLEFLLRGDREPSLGGSRGCLLAKSCARFSS